MSQIMLLSVYLGSNTAYVPQGIESVNGSSPNMTCSHGETAYWMTTHRTLILAR